MADLAGGLCHRPSAPRVPPPRTAPGEHAPGLHNEVVTARTASAAAPVKLPLHAWVDESIKVTPDEQGTYILASVVCDPTRCDAVRQTLTSLCSGTRRRLHWHEEAPARRTKIAKVIGGIDMAAIVVIGTSMARNKQERARRICMETLLPELQHMGVSQVLLEARTPTLNEKDRRQVASLIGKRVISSTLRVSTGRPSEEPMLWVPDAVAGAVAADRDGRSQWLDLLRQTVTQIEVPIR